MIKGLPLVDRSYKKQTSAIDSSVNFIKDLEDSPGKLEARYVRREDDYFIVYLSSQSGCAKACRFCHLTQTGQTKGIDADLEDYLTQADQVLAHYDQQVADGLQKQARIVHFNFMSRGEALANSFLHQPGNGDLLCSELKKKAVQRGLIPKLKFSSIFPSEMKDLELTDLFKVEQPDIYYSLYSLNPTFRKRWLPKALDPDLVFEKLLRYQKDTNKIVNLHWAFIAGENDDEQTIREICDKINSSGLKTKINIVRYNPFSSAQGEESPPEVWERNRLLFEKLLPGNVDMKVVSRVGFDVKASCGMFVGGRPDKLVKAGT